MSSTGSFILMAFLGCLCFFVSISLVSPEIIYDKPPINGDAELNIFQMLKSNWLPILIFILGCFLIFLSFFYRKKDRIERGG